MCADATSVVECHRWCLHSKSVSMYRPAAEDGDVKQRLSTIVAARAQSCGCDCPMSVDDATQLYIRWYIEPVRVWSRGKVFALASFGLCVRFLMLRGAFSCTCVCVDGSGICHLTTSFYVPRKNDPCQQAESRSKHSTLDMLLFNKYSIYIFSTFNSPRYMSTRTRI